MLAYNMRHPKFSTEGALSSEEQGKGEEVVGPVVCSHPPMALLLMEKVRDVSCLSVSSLLTQHLFQEYYASINSGKNFPKMSR